MPISFTHLYDGEAFTADSINTRFESAMGTAVGVNGIGADDVALGAFGHQHLPSLLHVAGASPSVLTSDQAFTNSSVGDLNSRQSITALTIETANEIGAVEFPVGLVPKIGMAAPSSSGKLLGSKLGAIVVLGNVFLYRFKEDALAETRAINEDILGLAVFVRLRVSESAGTYGGFETEVLLTRSVRVSSPRVLISNDTLLQPHYGSIGDKITRQDIAIRTIIQASDLPTGFPHIRRVQLCGFLVGDDASNGWIAKVSKWNLTALPLHVDFVEVT